MGELVRKSWRASIYEAINNVITNFTKPGTISNVSSNTTKITATDVNNLFSKLDQMKKDPYMKDHESLKVQYVAVAQGEKIAVETRTSLDSIVSKFSTLKCRNTVSYSNTSKSNESKQNESHGNGSCPHGNHSQQTSNSRGSHTNNGKDKGDVTAKTVFCGTNGVCLLGTKTNGTKTNGTYTKGSAIDTANTKTIGEK